jgi:hypothetical protein
MARKCSERTCRMKRCAGTFLPSTTNVTCGTIKVSDQCRWRLDDNH